MVTRARAGLGNFLAPILWLAWPNIEWADIRTANLCA